jgi:S-adenosylmethionine:tRNA ribosyltransferase-isomerase
MQRRDFAYELPDHLIAQTPPATRGASRLLCLDGSSGRMRAGTFADFPQLLEPGDLVVLNDTRVLPARIHARKQSGGQVEVLLERILDGRRCLAQVRASKPLRAGGRIVLTADSGFEVLDRQGEFYELQTYGEQDVEHVFASFGQMPLPPYIKRVPDASDTDRYQTVYGTKPGAVAAPTAGLHFDLTMLERLRERNVDVGYVTLHVGAGTFQPLRSDELSAHRMHSEHFEVSEQLCGQALQARQRGKRIVAIGTTVVRALEAASSTGQLLPTRGATRIFIYPGYRFRSVDALLTNFHLPESTLLMLVCAFAGREQVLAAYRYAVAEQFRFFSYGDAMWVTPRAL